MPSTVVEFIAALTYPPYASLALVALALLALVLQRRRLGVALSTAALAWSLVWSIPLCSDWLRLTLERRNAVIDEASLPHADAIVVLGGGTRYSWLARKDVDPWELGSSRLAAGARAWLSQRAPVVILSGGRGGPRGSEARMMAPAIVRLGVPESALLLEERSRNTEDNAANTARLAKSRGIRRVLLVTSAVHMPRARLLFERAGLDVVAVPVPERARRDSWRQRWLPSPRALWRSGRAFKEYAGLLALSLRMNRASSPVQAGLIR